MPDYSKRKEREEDIAAALAPVFDEYRESSIAIYNNSGELPSRGFWETMKKRLASAVEPIIALVESDALNAMLVPAFSSLTTPENNSKIIRDAKKRAEEFSANFSDMVLTNISEKVPKAKQEKEGVSVFVQSMFEDIFADNKKTIIAVGLVTAAITAGEMFAAIFITALINTRAVASAILEERPERMGPATVDYEGIPAIDSDPDVLFEMIPTWMTQEDALVCPICGPLHGKTKENWGEFDGPPAHYMCRCFLEWVIRLSNEA
ncbi:MAG TPA: hypothetical protein DCW74_17115 [Alteromonas australica]|uniref:Phage head morphogenesis domain-containing protein n=1 Tax=Alteromonas australica TaxID=589873 RepID=A0A350P824_9ALTE|nr:hypothetical protein [Alteromonas australica]